MLENIFTKENAKELYVVAIIAGLGIFAFISAVLIAWPALAYLGAKMFVGLVVAG